MKYSEPHVLAVELYFSLLVHCRRLFFGLITTIGFDIVLRIQISIRQLAHNTDSSFSKRNLADIYKDSERSRLNCLNSQHLHTHRDTQKLVFSFIDYPAYGQLACSLMIR